MVAASTAAISAQCNVLLGYSKTFTSHAKMTLSYLATSCTFPFPLLYSYVYAVICTKGNTIDILLLLYTIYVANDKFGELGPHAHWRTF